MKIGFYNPYFDGFGGGERYTLTLASHWSKTHSVSLFWDDSEILNTAQNRFNLDLSRVRVTENVFKQKSIFKKLMVSGRYDLIFFLSDGSIPSTLAKHNILHFQVPFAKIRFNRLKMRAFDSIVCNSLFTKQSIDSKIGDKSIVIYPPVDTLFVETTRKSTKILTVGRFTSVKQAKKQEVMIEAFKMLTKNVKFKKWHFDLVGAVLPGDIAYLERLKEQAKGFSISFHPNISNKDLHSLYREASIYWHAAGFGETDPVNMEHFGISTVEAMSAGAIPIVFAGGGQKEIITNGVNGYLWVTPQELIEKTDLVSETKTSEYIRKAAITSSKDFDTSLFCKKFDNLLDKMQS